MKKILSGFVFVAIACTVNAQQAPQIEWQKCLGGSNSDNAYAIRQTIDGGYIIAGLSWSNDGDISGNHGNLDYWIIKLDAEGNLEWQKCLGGSGPDAATCIQQTTDGGFIIGGKSSSTDGDVSGNHGFDDYWIVKIDSAGNLIWQKCFGGSNNDYAYSIQQTIDGGYIVAGLSNSEDGDVSGWHEGYYWNDATYDYWIVKLNTDGDLVWQKCLGGTATDMAFSIKQTTDGGYIVAGLSNSEDGDVSGWHGSFDYWIAKLDSAGNLLWQKCLGGSDDDEAPSVIQINDGGYIVAGSTSSTDGDVGGNHGLYDYWIVKLDLDGSLVWQKCLGGTKVDQADAIQQTIDGGFIVVGITFSNNSDFSGNHGDGDYGIVKLDSNGNLMWQKCIGGSEYDVAKDIQETTDGGFIVAGYSSSIDGDVSGNHLNYYYYNYYYGYLDTVPTQDYWIVKLSPDIATVISSPPTTSISLHPNPVQNLLTITLTMQASNVTIRVYDLQGRRVFLPTSDLRLATSSIQLNTSSLPDGFYTLQITDNKTGESEVGKFVKQQ